MQSMSVLEKMGVQVWRLRGRRTSTVSNELVDPIDPVMVSNDETILSTASRDLEQQISGSMVQVSETSLDTREVLFKSVEADSVTKQSNALHETAPIHKDTASTEIEPLGVTSSVEMEQSVQSVPSLKPAPIPETKTSGTSSDVKELQKSSNAVPKLRPAPVPLQSENSLDLSISEPVIAAVTTAMSVDDKQAESDHTQIEEEFNNLSHGYSEYEQQDNSDPETNLNDIIIPKIAVDQVSDLSRPSMDWRSLQATISNSENCPSCGPSQSTLGFGDVLADWMFIADAPTTSDLEVQQLFFGRAGQLYENILSACGLTRAQVYSSTIFKCVAPADISLTPQCDRLIHTQISLVKPKCIVVFGEFASQAILQSNEPFERLIEGHHYYSGSGCLVIPAYAPQELLDNPRLKAKLWSNLRLAINELV